MRGPVAVITSDGPAGRGPGKVAATLAVLCLVVFARGLHAQDSKSLDERRAVIPRPPNVLLIYVDDWAEDLNVDLGMYFTSPVQVPNLDALARRSFVFENAYCPFPLCNPSRVAAMLGMRPLRTGVLDNVTPFYDNNLNGVPTLPYRFKQEGYTTGGAGKIFHGGYQEPSTWDEYYYDVDDPWVPFPPNPYPEDRANVLYFGPFENGADGSLGKKRETKHTDAGLDMMSRFPEPWFIAVGYHLPHKPFIYPEMWHGLYDECADVPPLPPQEASDRWKIGLDPDAYFSKVYAAMVPLPYLDCGESLRRHTTTAYWRCQTYVDDEIGRLLQGLGSGGLDRRTIVVYVSDHGFSNGHHDRYGKGDLFEWCARNRMMISAPGLAGGRSSSRPVEQVDLYPTVLELAGLDAPAGIDGQSLSPLMKDPTAPFKPAFTTFRKDYKSDLARMVRTDRYKFVYWPSGLYQLYDLTQDPGEYDNLFGDPAHDDVVFEHLQHLTDYGLIDGEAYAFNYGVGFPGTLGVPGLDSLGDPVLGGPWTLLLGNSYGQGTRAYVFAGLDRASLPSSFGGTYLVDPLLILPLWIAGTGRVLGAVLPNDPLLDGVDLYVQAMEVDPGAAFGFSFTRGLRATFGTR